MPGDRVSQQGPDMNIYNDRGQVIGQYSDPTQHPQFDVEGYQRGGAGIGAVPAPVAPQVAQAAALRRPSQAQIDAENAAAGPLDDPRALMRGQARRRDLAAPRQVLPRVGRMPVG